MLPGKRCVDTSVKYLHSLLCLLCCTATMHEPCRCTCTPWLAIMSCLMLLLLLLF